MNKYKLEIKMQGYWFSGTGHEAGAYADSIALKDELGFPFLPGKTVKGIFRNAFEIAEKNHWFDDKEGLVKTLFGREGSYFRVDKDTSEVVPHVVNDLYTSGTLHFSNAVIDPIVISEIKNNPDAIKLLYRNIQSTAIDENGIAKEGSLRSYEVCVPLSLWADVSFDGDEEISDSELLKILQNVSSLITEVGGKRRRGFGRCQVEITE